MSFIKSGPLQIVIVSMTQQYAPGIPVRVADYVNSVKKRFEENATQPSVKPCKENSQDLPVLPPGVSRKTFNEAIEQLRVIVDGHIELVDHELGDRWYLHRPLTYDVFALDDEDYFVNSAICAPGNVKQVQAVVKWANYWLIPIYAVSVGRNFGKRHPCLLVQVEFG